MPPQSSVDASGQRETIDALIQALVPDRAIARRFHLGPDAVRGHRKRYFPEIQPKSPRLTPRNPGITDAAGQDPRGVDGLIARLEQAFVGQTGRQAVETSRELRALYSIQAETGSTVGPDAWPALRRIILEATAGHPDVRLAIAEGIRAYEAAK